MEESGEACTYRELLCKYGKPRENKYWDLLHALGKLTGKEQEYANTDSWQKRQRYSVEGRTGSWKTKLTGYESTLQIRKAGRCRLDSCFRYLPLTDTVLTHSVFILTSSSWVYVKSDDNEWHPLSSTLMMDCHKVLSVPWPTSACASSIIHVLGHHMHSLPTLLLFLIIDFHFMLTLF